MPSVVQDSGRAGIMQFSVDLVADDCCDAQKLRWKQLIAVAGSARSDGVVT
jgi:hypothetical protein